MGYGFCVIGEDKRMFFAARYISEHYSVTTDPAQLGNSQVVVLPIYKEGSYEIMEACKGRTVLCGQPPAEVSERCQEMNIRVIDYLKREDFSVLGAVATAEGTIAILIEELGVTLWNSRFLITGYGRLAKTLAQKLHALGAQVSIAARKPGDLAWAEALGYTPIRIGELQENLRGYDAYINTPPALVFNREIINAIPPGKLIVDLASGEGGVDKAAAASAGVHVIHALSLPAKYSPETAGIILGKTIINMLDEGVFTL